MNAANPRHTKPRAPVCLPARLATGAEVLECRLLQLGRGGLFFRYAEGAPLPERFWVSFELPGQGLQTVEVDVRYRLKKGSFRGDRSASGVGCSFASINAKTQAAVNAFIDRQAKAYAKLQFSLAISPPPKELPRLLAEAGFDTRVNASVAREVVSWGLKQMGS